MKSHPFYSPSESPTPIEQERMWNSIEDQLPSPEAAPILMHWRSFWIGNVAAVVLIFALVGVYVTTNLLTTGTEQASASEDRMYETLTSATGQLKTITPLLLNTASEQVKPSIESRIQAIEDIDQMIEEMKNDMMINGITPAKEFSLKRLYATKLDFYKEILLDNEGQL
ncbi:MAG: hypothetical protein AAFW89_11025 [Bacteroidota bacterium]